MINIISKTGVPYKNRGDGLSSQDINSINGTTNSCVDAINPLLLSFCNINTEIGDQNRTFTLEQAIELVPENRRIKGLKVRYLTKSGNFSEVIYLGNSSDAVDWINPSNWSSGDNIIDGGDW